MAPQQQHRRFAVEALVVDGGLQLPLPPRRQGGQQRLHPGMHPGLAFDRVGGVDPHLPPAHPQQLSQGLPVPGEVEVGAFAEAAVGDRGVTEEQVAAEHQIEAGRREG